MYINNIPDGIIPTVKLNEDYVPGQFPPQSPVKIMNNNQTSFRGLVPGMISGMSNINPLGIFTALTTDTSKCKKIKMETIDIDNIRRFETRYVSITDIERMSPCWFPTNMNPITRAKCRTDKDRRKSAGKNKVGKAINKFKKDVGKRSKKIKKSIGKTGKKMKKAFKIGFTNRCDTPTDVYIVNRIAITYFSILTMYAFINVMKF